MLGEIGEKNIPNARKLHKGGTYLAIEGRLSQLEQNLIYIGVGDVQ